MRDPAAVEAIADQRETFLERKAAEYRREYDFKMALVDLAMAEAAFGPPEPWSGSMRYPHTDDWGLRQLRDRCWAKLCQRKGVNP